MRDEPEEDVSALTPSQSSKQRRARTKTSKRSQPPAMRGEFEFIDRIRREALRRLDPHQKLSSLVPHPSSLLLGIGDDAAVIRNGRAGSDLVVTADLLVEGVDFRLSTTTPRLLGHKALAVSLSDVAAMGARPRFALLSVGAPARVWAGSFLDEFYEGFFALADQYGVALVGGDVSRTGARRAKADEAPLVVDSVVLGEVRRGRAVTRSGARPGDLIFVTGALGGAAAGLRLLEEGRRLKAGTAADKRRDATGGSGGLSDARRSLILRQLRPEPRVEWGQHLGEHRLATSMIDLSDGLSSDLAHLCRESGVGARLDASRIPVDPHAARAYPDDALGLALDGGEDFELLFTAAPRRARLLPAEVEGVPVTCVGEVTDRAGEVLLVEGGRGRAFKPSGFAHF